MVDTGGYPAQPRSTRDPSLLAPQGGNGDRDSSWPLHAMYSKIAQEEDNNDAEHRQQDIDGILVFVSPHVNSPFSVPSIEEHRPVYSPPLSRHCLLSQSQTSSLALRTRRPSTLRTFISFWLIRMDLLGRSHPLWPNHPHSIHRHTSSW